MFVTWAVGRTGGGSAKLRNSPVQSRAISKDSIWLISKFRGPDPGQCANRKVLKARTFRSRQRNQHHFRKAGDTSLPQHVHDLGRGVLRMSAQVHQDIATPSDRPLPSQAADL